MNLLIFILVFLALYAFVAALICLERDDGQHGWCPCCWLTIFYWRFR
jgi:hypothetical protein